MLDNLKYFISLKLEKKHIYEPNFTGPSLNDFTVILRKLAL